MRTENFVLGLSLQSNNYYNIINNLTLGEHMFRMETEHSYDIVKNLTQISKFDQISKTLPIVEQNVPIIDGAQTAASESIRRIIS